MGKRDEIVKKINKVLNRVYPDSEVYLFGSQARGDSKTDSDWDVLILINSESLAFDFETRLMDEIYEIEIKTGEIITPLIYTKKDWNNKYSITPLHENVQNEGIKIK